MLSRIEKIKDTYSVQLEDKLKKSKVSISILSAWDILISADPSSNKKNVRWLIDTYLNNGFLWEDIASGPASKVAETLVEFDKHKRNLEVSERSLMKYRTLGSLWASIKPYVGQLTTGEEKREEREKAYNEADVIIEKDNGFKIVVPKTEFSAKWFGRGTRWCTSADNDNMFYEYAQDAPLFVILMPNGDKLQLWTDNEDVQFMDENDDNVTLKYIEKHWEHMQHIAFFIGDINLIPEKYHNPEIYLNSLKKSLNNITEMKAQFIDVNIRDYLMEENNLSDVNLLPEPLLDREFCDKYAQILIDKSEETYFTPNLSKLTNMSDDYTKGIISHFPSAITMLSKKHFDNHELIKFLIATYPNSTDLIYNQYQELEILSVKHFSDYFTGLDIDKLISKNLSIFSYLPYHMKTEKRCMDIVDKDGWRLKYIPEKYKTQELCKKAFLSNVYAISSTPKEYITRKMVRLAFHEKIPLRNIHYDFDNDLLKEAVTLNVNIDNIEEKYIHQILKIYGDKIVDIPNFPMHVIPAELRTARVWKSMVNENYSEAMDITPYIPEHIKTKSFMLDIAKKCPRYMLHVDEKLWTEDMIDNIFRHGSSMISEISEKYITPERCKMAVKENATSILCIPDKYITKELFLESFDKRPAIISQMIYEEKTLKDEFMTPEVIQYMQFNDLIYYIPEKFITSQDFDNFVERNKVCPFDVPEDKMTPYIRKKQSEILDAIGGEKYQKQYIELQEAFSIEPSSNSDYSMR